MNNSDVQAITPLFAVSFSKAFNVNFCEFFTMKMISSYSFRGFEKLYAFHSVQINVKEYKPYLQILLLKLAILLTNSHVPLDIV